MQALYKTAQADAELRRLIEQDVKEQGGSVPGERIGGGDNYQLHLFLKFRGEDNLTIMEIANKLGGFLIEDGKVKLSEITRVVTNPGMFEL
jgi:hypothetical protein